MEPRIIDSLFSKVYLCAHSTILPELIGDRRVVVLTDTNIFALYNAELSCYEHIVIDGGEANKNLATVQHIYRQLMDMGVDRSTLLLGVGGGIVTDITGFVAATYMRGIKFGFISTSLLGQVDASVGGKCGVNLDDYKNMVGCFAHPEFVILDVDMLQTLPKRELCAGMAEVVKSAIIGDYELFEMVEQHAEEPIYEDRNFMQEVVARSLKVKLSIVEKDEHERGMRRLLNLGHTLGHAIEKCTHDVNHGEAVAIGMAMICRAAERQSKLNAVESLRIIELLNKLGLATNIAIPISNILPKVKLDKKKIDNMLNVVMPCEIGRCEVVSMEYDSFVEMFE